jgi:hypothetical protein
LEQGYKVGTRQGLIGLDHVVIIQWNEYFSRIQVSHHRLGDPLDSVSHALSRKILSLLSGTIDRRVVWYPAASLFTTHSRNTRESSALFHRIPPPKSTR